MLFCFSFFFYHVINNYYSQATVLTTLELRSTSPVWSMMKNGIPSLTTLDISENKIAVKDNSVDDVLGFLRGCTGLQNLNMSWFVAHPYSFLYYFIISWSFCFSCLFFFCFVLIFLFSFIN